MKLARLILAALTTSVLAACNANPVSAPATPPPDAPAADLLQCAGAIVREVRLDGSIVFRCDTPVLGSGG